jgi:hypothetical protein
MQIDPAAEWQRLTPLYREMCDEELLSLAAEMNDLTEMAQQVLRDELRRRGLSDGPPRQAAERSGRLRTSQSDSAQDFSTDEDSNDESDPLHEFTWKTLLCLCDTQEQAWQIQEVLRRSGIESWIEGSKSKYSMDQQNPRVLVAADELDLAREIAARPIPQDIVDESRMGVPEFESPRCPRCGGEDPVLESVEPCNSWACESCGNEWTESVEDPKWKAGNGGR